MSLVLVLFGAVLWSASASAAIGGELTRFSEPGSAAGQLRMLGVGGIATDATSGHIFVADVYNHRVSEFTAWGDFVKSWGWGVADGSSTSPQTCTNTCFKGLAGAGAGQLNEPYGIAVAAGGDIYVFERQSRRVQVFSPAGQFQRMFGGGVNATTGADVCTKADVEGGDVCGVGSAGVGPSEFSIEQIGESTNKDYIDIGPDGTVFVGDRDRIQTFEPDGTFKAAIPLPEPGNPGALAIDQASGDIYFAFAPALNGSIFEPSNTFRLSPTGSIRYALPTTAPEGIATDPSGIVYVSDDPFPFESLYLPERSPWLLEIDPLGALVESCCHSSSDVSVRPFLPGLTTNVVTAAGGVDLYVVHSDHVDPSITFVEIRGPAPDKWPPPTVPPTIEGQFASSVSTDSAVLKAEINPNFWDDTRYYLEFGTSACSGGGCQTVPAPPGNLLGGGIVKKSIRTEGIELGGLQPNTTYHYRFVADSGGGGPVEGVDRTFTTFGPPPPPDTECPNQAFRTATPSAALPDCRAYEMVSPVDKLGGDIVVQCTHICLRARLNQSSSAGEEITYSSYRAFGDAESAGYTSQYLASRGAGGWATHGISPVREGSSVFGTTGLDSQYRGFSEDLSSGWLLHDTEPMLAPGAVAGYANLYRREDLSGGYEALTTVAPLIATDPKGYKPELQGFSADGKRAFFTTRAKLTANASANPINQVYEAFEGQLRLVSVRPNGGSSIDDASVGAGGGVSVGGDTEGRSANLTNAVSEDGSRIYWSEINDPSARTGKIYVRVGATKTIAVSAGSAAFWAATPTGSRAIYTEDGSLELFDLETKASTPLASGVQGVLGQSEDLSQIYFLSLDALAGGAEAGKPNLYLHEEGGALGFIATLSGDDLKSEPAVSPIAREPMRRASRVSPNGAVAVFMSRAALTGADNLDAVSGEPAAEVFRYEAGADELVCVSCSPSGARATGEEYVRNNSPSGYWYASQIRGWEFQLHAPRFLSEDGSRVFFDSFNRLVTTDENDQQDVYQWEGPGTGKCTEASPEFNAAAAGCISLISSGQGAGESEFIDASADGRDVFFTTGASLVSQDPDQVDLYDARVGGGFAAPIVPDECGGEGCQMPSPPPLTPPYASQDFVGPGNPKPPARCKRGFVRRNGKCVRKNHAQKKGKQHGRSRGGRR